MTGPAAIFWLIWAGIFVTATVLWPLRKIGLA